MKVLHICSDYYGTILYSKLISKLFDKGVDSTIYVPKYRKGETESFIYTAPREYNIFDRILYLPKEILGYKDVRNRVDLADIKIIHSHNLFSGGYIAYKLNRKYGIPYIVAIRNTDLNIFFRFMIHLRNLGVSIMKGATAIVFISPAYKETVIEKYVPKKIRQEILSKSIVIPNGIDEFFLNRIYDRTGYDWDGINMRLICVSSLNKNKNIDTTIKVCERLIQLGFKVKLTLIGEVQETKYNTVEHKYPFVTYYPPCDKESILRYLRSSDIMIMPSITETFGLVYAEALSQGLPVIYTQGQGFDGFFTNGEVGFSVSPYDSIFIANKVIEIYKNYKTMSRNSIENVSRFSWKGITNIYINQYQTSIFLKN